MTAKRLKPTKASATAAYYLRVSSDEQKRSGLGIEAQRTACHAELERRGLVPSQATEYKDEGISGTKPILKRPGLRSLINDVQTGKISMVITLDTSRIARKVTIIKHAADTFISNNVIFVSIKESYIDTSTAVGAMLFHNKIAIDQFEADITGERTKAALAERKRKYGYAAGNLPMGYTRNPETEIISIHETNAALVRIIFALRAEGHTLQFIADQMAHATHKNWYPGTVRVILNNQAKYRGAELGFPQIVCD